MFTDSNEFRKENSFEYKCFCQQKNVCNFKKFNSNVYTFLIALVSNLHVSHLINVPLWCAHWLTVFFRKLYQFYETQEKCVMRQRESNKIKVWHDDTADGSITVYWPYWKTPKRTCTEINSFAFRDRELCKSKHDKCPKSIKLRPINHVVP